MFARCLLGSWLLLSLASADRPQWLAIGSPALLEAAKPLAEHRRAQGLEVRLSSLAPAKAIAEAQPQFVLLLGDDSFGQKPFRHRLPAQRHQLHRWRAMQAEDFASDAAFGDMDQDGIPEIPVGRIPARSAKELAMVVAKILAYENKSITEADLGLPVWAADPNYGGHFSAAMASALLRTTVQNRAPHWAEPWFLVGNPADVLCGCPTEQPEVFNQRLAGGACLATMMGHGDRANFFAVPHDGAWVTYGALQAASLPRAPTAPLVIFACDCGNFAASDPCLAESLLMAAGGPVAVIAASTESHPLPNYYSAVSLLKVLGTGENRLGNLWQQAQREGHLAREWLVETFAKGLEGQVGGKLNTAKIRDDHLKLYVLLGDPATRLAVPMPLPLTSAKHGNTWRWTVEKPPEAAILEVSHRDVVPLMIAPSAKDPAADRAALLAANEALRFRPVLTRTAEETWAGTAEKPGVWRFLCRVNGRIHAGGFAAVME